jgi:four helix bundle suffix protein
MEKLIGSYGGYRKLKSFQISQLIFDITMRFCDKFIDKKSRTHDQMIQAARSGVQNIAEGSQASSISKSTEMKLTSVARASLEELKLDYQDFLRQRGLKQWSYGDSRGQELIDLRLTTAEEFVRWAGKLGQTTGENVAEIAANGLLVLLSVACALLDRQLKAQVNAFQKEGDFTEKLYRSRREAQ